MPYVIAKDGTDRRAVLVEILLQVPDPDQEPARRVALLAQKLWQQHGGDPQLVRKDVVHDFRYGVRTLLGVPKVTHEALKAYARRLTKRDPPKTDDAPTVVSAIREAYAALGSPETPDYAKLLERARTTHRDRGGSAQAITRMDCYRFVSAIKCGRVPKPQMKPQVSAAQKTAAPASLSSTDFLRAHRLMARAESFVREAGSLDQAKVALLALESIHAATAEA